MTDPLRPPRPLPTAPALTGGRALVRAARRLSRLSAAALLALTTLAAALPAPPAAAQQVEAEARGQRIAVIVGNSAYTDFPALPNAVNDAVMVADFFAQTGYRVIFERDLDKDGFADAMQRLVREMPEDATVVFYYAGHGFQVGSENFLLPVDARIESVYDVRAESLSLANVIDTLSRRSRLRIFILDSCRDNPFAGREAIVGLGQDVERLGIGFSFQPAPINSLIAFSTAPGAVAYDGAGKNSPFTLALVENARSAPTTEIATVLSRVRRDVFRRTSGEQISWENSSLIDPFFIVDPGAMLVQTALTGPDAGDGADRDAPARGRPVAAAAGAADARLTVAARRERAVPLGADLIAALDDRGADALALDRAPSGGWLGTRLGGFMRMVAPGETLDRAQLASLTYYPDALAPGDTVPDDEALDDAFAVEVAGSTVDVAVDLALDPCDRLAGGLFDPQGVGPGVHNYDLEPVPALRACREAVAAFPDVARFTYQLSRALKANGLFEESDAALEDALRRGHRRARVGLGAAIIAESAREGGLAGGRAPDAAIDAFAIAHEGGDPIATYALGRQYLRYGATPEEKELGFVLLNQAKDAGYVEALAELGAFYLTAEDDLRDPERGLRFLQEAAARGNVAGQHSLGTVLGFGVGGVAPDRETAIALLEASAKAGHPTSPRILADLVAEGDPARAIALLDMGLARGDAFAGLRGAQITLAGGVSGQTPFAAASRAARAAVLRDETAAAEARALLDGLDTRTVDGGTQLLLTLLGQSIAVDGAFGPGSRSAFEAELGAMPEAPGERLLAAARAYWDRNAAFRPDLY